MTKTTAQRVRQTNLYTVECDGKPVAQAMAISQAAAVRLYVESVRQPVLSARLASPMEARTLAHLPLVAGSAPAVVDDCTADLFGAGEMAQPAPVVEPVPAVEAPQAAEPEIGIEGMEQQIHDLLAARPGECVAGDCAGSASLPADASPGSAELAEVAAVLPGEPAACLDAAPTVAESDGACSEEVRPLKSVEGLTQRDDQRHPYAAEQAASQPEAARQANGGKVAARYRDPATGQAWSGRGLKPRWLVAAIEAGKTLGDFLIDQT